MINIGIRNNLIYPGMFIFFILLRRIDKALLERMKYYCPFLLALIKFISEFIFSLIIYYYLNKKKNSKKKTKIIGIELIQNEQELNPVDNEFKIYSLIIFASYFEFVGSISRRYLIPKIYDSYQDKDHIENIDYRVRSIEICFASFLCYFTLRNRIYKHHKFSLIIIGICLIIVFVTEIIVFLKRFENFRIFYFITIILISSICRAFLDTTEKYLMEYNYIDPFKLLRNEGFIDIIFVSFFYFFKEPRNELKKLKYFNRIEILKICILLIIYSILSGFKNIYRLFTIKLYSPMTRALAESILDPIFIIYSLKFENDFRIGKEQKTNWIYFGIIISCSFIMVFCSCVYNEFLVLYCCRLEYQTYLEIKKRAISQEFSYDNDDLLDK